MSTQNSLADYIQEIVDSIRAAIGSDAPVESRSFFSSTTDAQRVAAFQANHSGESFFNSLTDAQRKEAIEKNLERRTLQQRKAAAQAGRSQVSSDPGWFGALIRYGGRVQEIQNRTIYFQMAYTAHQAKRAKEADGTARKQLQFEQRASFFHPYSGPDTSDPEAKAIGQKVTNPELTKRGWDAAPQAVFMTESAPVVIIDTQKNRVNMPLFNYPYGNAYFGHTGLFSELSLEYDAAGTWFRAGDVIRGHVRSMRALGNLNRKWSGRFPSDSIDRENPLTVVRPGWWKAGGATYRDRLIRYLQIARWCVWAAEQARVNADVSLSGQWAQYCAQWGVSVISDDMRTMGRFVKLDTYSQHLQLLKSPDQFWRSTHPAENLAMHATTIGSLDLAQGIALRWMANIMQAAPSLWTDGNPILQNRRLCDIPPDAASLLPPVWVSAADMQRRIDSINSWLNAKQMHDLQEARFVSAITGMAIKIAVAIIVTAATWGGAAPAGGAMIAGGVQQIAEACKNLIAGGAQAAMSIIQTAIETYGPALVQRLINRALQAADIGIDIPNLSDAIAQGLPVVGDDTLEATGARLRSALSGVQAAGYDYLGDLSGNMLDTAGRYVPEIPNFTDRFKL